MAAYDIKAGSAFVELYTKDEKFRRGFQRAGRTLSSFARSAAAIAAPLAGAFAFKSAIQAASDLEETMNKFNVVFGESATRVKEWGDEFAKQVGRSEEQIARFMANSQDLFVPLGFDSESAEAMSKQVAQLSLDLASFNNMADDDTIRDLHAALTGSGEVMKKYGVIVSEAAVKQELLNQGMNPQIATDQEKVQARLNIIMRGTTAAQGDAIRSAGGYANQLKALQGRTADAAAAIGELLLPAVTQVVGVTADVVQSISELARGFADTWQYIGSITGEFYTWFQENTFGVVSALSYAWNNFGLVIETAMVSSQLSVVRWANETVYLFSSVIPEWLSWFGDNWRDVFTDVANVTATVAGNIWENLKGLWDAIVSLFNGEGFQFTWTPLTEGFRSAIKELPQIAARELGPLEETLQKEINRLGEEMVSSWEDHSRAFEMSIAEFAPKQREMAAAAANGVAANLPAAPGRTARQSQGEVFSSFSAAALAAQGQGGGGIDKVEKAIKEEGAKRKEDAMAIVNAIRDNGGLES